MWRALGALLLTFVAMAWAIFSVALCFFYASAFLREYFGRFGAFYAAVFAYVCCLMGAHFLLRAADRLVEPYSGPFDGGAYAASPRDTFYHDWRRYAESIARSRRYALYARTRQWDKVAALEAQHRSLDRAPTTETNAPSQGDALPAPQRTSVGSLLAPQEVERAARRTADAPPPSTSRRPDYWRRFDEE